jgi:pteridine reductase
MEKPQAYQYLALVTGAGHRLGRAIALDLGQQGYAIGLHYHQSREKAEATRDELAEMGVPVYLLQADLTDETQLTKLFASLGEIPCLLKVLVNSAGIMTRGNVKSLTVEEWDQTLALNLKAPWLCSKLAAEEMGESGGVIINISDSGAHRPWTNFAAYVVSKAALEALTRILARTLAPSIRVNAIAPGLILPSEDMAVEDWNRLVARLPLKKSGSLDVITNGVRFLLQNEYVTGHILVVDGGYQLV